MIIAEHAEILVAKPVDEFERAARIAVADIGPRGQQRRGDVALLPGAALREIGARGANLPLFALTPSARWRDCCWDRRRSDGPRG